MIDIIVRLTDDSNLFLSVICNFCANLVYFSYVIFPYLDTNASHCMFYR